VEQEKNKRYRAPDAYGGIPRSKCALVFKDVDASLADKCKAGDVPVYKVDLPVQTLLDDANGLKILLGFHAVVKSRGKTDARQPAGPLPCMLRHQRRA
jgi:hypothetical protein